MMDVKRPLRAGMPKTLFAIGILTLLAAGPSAAEVYFYRDADGVFHFTNKPSPGTVRFEMDESTPRQQATRRSSPLNRKVRHDKYDGVIREVGERYRVEPALVKAVIRAESDFNPFATSKRGARGLMQLMPPTAKKLGVLNAYDPQENIHGGVKYLRRLLDEFGNNVPFALAAYNAGIGAVRKHRGIPPYEETQGYVRRVLRFRRDYQRDTLFASM